MATIASSLEPTPGGLSITKPGWINAWISLCLALGVGRFLSNGVGARILEAAGYPAVLAIILGIAYILLGLAANAICVSVLRIDRRRFSNRITRSLAVAALVFGSLVVMGLLRAVADGIQRPRQSVTATAPKGPPSFEQYERKVRSLYPNVPDDEIATAYALRFGGSPADRRLVAAKRTGKQSDPYSPSIVTAETIVEPLSRANDFDLTGPGLKQLEDRVVMEASAEAQRHYLVSGYASYAINLVVSGGHEIVDSPLGRQSVIVVVTLPAPGTPAAVGTSHARITGIAGANLVSVRCWQTGTAQISMRDGRCGEEIRAAFWPKPG